MRADASAHLGQGTGLVVEVGGLGETSLLDEPHGRGNVVMRGAGRHARSGIGAVDTARRLDHGPLRVELNHHILEIAGAFFGWTEVQIEVRFIGASLAVDGQEFAGDCLHNVLLLNVKNKVSSDG